MNHPVIAEARVEGYEPASVAGLFHVGNVPAADGNTRPTFVFALILENGRRAYLCDTKPFPNSGPMHRLSCSLTHHFHMPGRIEPGPDLLGTGAVFVRIEGEPGNKFAKLTRAKEWPRQQVPVEPVVPDRTQQAFSEPKILRREILPGGQVRVHRLLPEQFDSGGPRFQELPTPPCSDKPIYWSVSSLKHRGELDGLALPVMISDLVRQSQEWTALPEGNV